MKLQLGTLHLDGRPAALAELSALLGEFADRPAETTGEIVDGPLLMAYRGDRITYEEDSETQPLYQPPYTLTWDGRLDNREDFGMCFPTANLQSVSDPAVVLKAYQTFGESVFEKLIGEFALALWCERTRSLLFVRSACGTRPLYYVLDGNRLLWSSNFAHLVRVSRVDLTVNDQYVLQYLVTTPDIKQTPLAKVQAIPPNRIVHFKNGQMQCGSELWNPIHILPLRYRTDAEYEEHCREKIKEAVRVRLRSKYPIFSELSGGLDSSTVVLVADQILRSRNESPHNLQTVSCVYEESKSADERSFIRAVAEHREIETHLIHEKEQRITLGLDDPEFTGLPTTLHCFPGRYEVFSTIMQQSNARVLLTGKGGDHLFWSAPQGAPLVADQLLRINLIGAHRECHTWSKAATVPYYTFLTHSVLPAAIGSLFPEKHLGEPPELPAWVHPKYRVTIAGLAAEFDGYTNWRTAPSRRAQAFVVGLMFRMFGSGFGEEYPQIYISHPYSHRPLIEFCLSVPLSQHLRNGATRSLMRRAMQDLLPTKTAKRVSKGLVDECVIRALAREQVTVADLTNWQVCRHGYVVQSYLTEALRVARMGMVHLFGPMIRLFSLERWLRSLDRVDASQPSDRTLRNSLAGLRVSA
jgi:asparagine synthase (glutamine-hydrolysing)